MTNRLSLLLSSLAILMILVAPAAGAATATSKTTDQATTYKTRPGTIKMAPRVVPTITEKPDLVIGSINFMSGTHPKVGDTLRVAVTIWNTGKVTSPNGVFTLILRPGPGNQQTPAAYSKNLSLPAIDPQRAASVEDSIVLTNYTPGGWVAEVRIDPQNQIAESNESNNINHQLFSIY